MRSPDADRALLAALRAGDESAFRTLVGRHQTAMLAVALRYVHDRDAAQDVVQETWMALLRRVHSFEGRSSLRTWLFAVLVNRARTHGGRGARLLPGLDGARVLGDDSRWPGHWAEPPQPWRPPAAAVEARELRRVVAAAIATLPSGQRAVMTLRAVDGWTSAEVCEVLDISAGNQRVLLHRARSKVRAALASDLAPDEP
jgi:RNA polymerase sigma-70 factor (ECF subfamily)